MSDQQIDLSQIDNEHVRAAVDRGERAIKENAQIKSQLAQYQRNEQFDEIGLPRTGPAALLRAAYTGEVTPEGVAEYARSNGIDPSTLLTTPPPPAQQQGSYTPPQQSNDQAAAQAELERRQQNLAEWQQQMANTGGSAGGAPPSAETPRDLFIKMDKAQSEGEVLQVVAEVYQKLGADGRVVPEGIYPDEPANSI